MDPLRFLVELARMLGVLLAIPEDKRLPLIGPGDPGAPPPAPTGDLDPDVAAAIDGGEL